MKLHTRHKTTHGYIERIVRHSEDKSTVIDTELHLDRDEQVLAEHVTLASCLTTDGLDDYRRGHFASVSS